VRASREIDIDSVRSIIRRNAIQDMELARKVDKEGLRKQWEAPRPPGAEWYLKLRDWIYRRVPAPNRER
jgi:hypothetical protein